MLSVDRQRRLLAHLRTRGSGDVVALAEVLGVSESTVRRDLRQLDQRGLLTRVYGGASVAPVTDVLPEPGPASCVDAIGRAAADLVVDGSSVLVLGGTITAAMLPHLAGRRGLTVLTNGLDIARVLAGLPDVAVVVLGGVLRHEQMATLGPMVDQVLAEFHVDRAFCTGTGIDAEHGLSTDDVGAAGMERRMLHRAADLVVLSAGSAVGRRGPVRLADIAQIAHLVTDAEASPAELDALRSRGVDVVVAPITT